MRLGSSALLCLAPVLWLGGCGRAAHHAGAPAPALAPKNALNAGGEPQWSAQVRGGQLRFSTGEDPELDVKATVADHGKAGATWTGPLPAGGAAGSLRLSVLPKPCQDGPTGMSYPLTASVQVAGRRYDGCAAQPGQGLGPRT